MTDWATKNGRNVAAKLSRMPLGRGVRVKRDRAREWLEKRGVHVQEFGGKYRIYKGSTEHTSLALTGDGGWCKAGGVVTCDTYDAALIAAVLAVEEKPDG